MMVHSRSELISLLKLPVDRIKISYLKEDSDLTDPIEEIEYDPDYDIYLEPAMDGTSNYLIYSLDDDGEVDLRGVADPEAVALIIYSVGYWNEILIQFIDFDPALPIPELVD